MAKQPPKRRARRVTVWRQQGPSMDFADDGDPAPVKYKKARISEGHAGYYEDNGLVCKAPQRKGRK